MLTTDGLTEQAGRNLQSTTADGAGLLEMKRHGILSLTLRSDETDEGRMIPFIKALSNRFSL